MLNLFRTKTFLKDYRKIKFSDKHHLKYVIYITTLLKEEVVPKEARDHDLTGKYTGYREFHISGDLLIIYTIKKQTLELIRIGSHSELFKR